MHEIKRKLEILKLVRKILGFFTFPSYKIPLCARTHARMHAERERERERERDVVNNLPKDCNKIVLSIRIFYV